MTFIETSLFTKLLPDYLSDEEYRSLQWYLFEHPQAGSIIRGSSGVRKIRWSQEGKGKRATIPAHTLRKISEEIKNEQS